MGRMDNPGIWDKIQKSVQETEQLVIQNKNTLSMIKARQTLEYIVKLQCDKAGMVEGPTDTMIRELYRDKWISRSTAEHYLQILALGNRADSEGDTSPDNARLALQLLQEEAAIFSGETPPVRSQQSSSQRSGSARSSSGSRPRSSSRDASGSRVNASARQAASRTRSGSGRSGSKRRKKSGLDGTDLLKLLIPVVLIVILIFLIRLFSPKPTPNTETTPAPTTPPVTTEAPTTTAAPETTAPPETEPVVYKTTTTLNVRQGPSTDSSRIGKLDPDVTVEYVEDYDDSWAVIMYNNQQAYVSKEYLTEAGE